MKRITFFLAFFIMVHTTFAGGVLTNSNQSAQYIRMLSRNASFDIDAVYSNPAGLIKLENGLHFAFNSQTIFQEKTVESSFPLLNDGYYKGTTEVPVFPTAFAVYKMKNWAFSLGFGPNSGGGSAEFERGLPVFEIPISQTRSLLSDLGVTGYDADLYFKGTSVFWGIQLGATYEINEMFSVYGGVRYLPSRNVYEGHIKNIELEMGEGNFVPAPTVLTQAAAALQPVAGVADMLAPYLDAGGSFTLAQLQGLGFIDANTKGLIEAGLLQAMGIPQQQIDAMQLNQIHGAYAQLKDQVVALGESAEKMQDRIVDTEQTGNGFTPIIGLNFSPNDDWNIGFKYEMKTSLDLKNEPKEGSNYDLWGESVSNDIPAIFASGVGYRGLDWLEAQLSYSMYMDNGVEWGPNINDLVVWTDVNPEKIRERKIENSYYELALGLQFNLSENFAFSIGGMRSKSGCAECWQNDLSFSNSSYTVGGGFMWEITDQLVLDAGVSNTFYQDDEVEFEYPGLPDMSGNPITSYSNNYGKTTINFAVGLSYSIF